MVNVTINNGTETFTFETGMISKVTSQIVPEIDKNPYPASGPMSNQGFDNTGVVKVITVVGQLYDTDSTVLSTQNCKDKAVMKLWLEAIPRGTQLAMSFTSNYEYVSVISPGIMNVTDAVTGETITLQALFGLTKVYLEQLEFDEEEANPELIPFRMNLWVAGS